MKTHPVLLALILAGVPAAHAGEVTLIAPGGIRVAIDALAPDFEKATGNSVKATYGSGGGTKDRVIKGEAFDVPVVQLPLEPVIASGHVVAASETPLASVAVGLAVREGAAKPDISSGEALKRVLLDAKSVAYPSAARGAAAGVSIDETLVKLGIAEAVKAKVKPAQTGAGAMEMAAKGEVEIGMTFMSEMQHTPGIAIVGPLPADVSTPTALVAFVSASAKDPAAAKALIAYLSSPEAAAVYKAKGMIPGH